MSRQNSFYVLTLLVVFALGLGYYFFGPTAGKGVGKETETRQIRIAQAGKFFLYAPLYVAVDQGFFEDQGLDVSIVSTGGDDKTWAAVLSGDASFGIADPTFIAIAAQRGQEGRVVGNIVNGVPFWGIALEDSIGPIDQASDLAPYTVGAFAAPSTAYVLQRRMFESAGLEPNIREGAFGAIIPMLRIGQVDIALELEPNVSQAVANGAHVVYSMADVYGDFAITGLTTTPNVIENDTELVADVTCALQQSFDFIRSDRSRALDLLLERFTGIDRPIAADAIDRVIEGGILPETPVTPQEAWQKNLDLRVEVGDLQQPDQPNRFLENRFAREASQQCSSGDLQP